MSRVFAIAKAAVYGARGWGRMSETIQPAVNYPQWPKWDMLSEEVYERFPRLDSLSKAAGIVAELVLGRNAPLRMPRTLTDLAWAGNTASPAGTSPKNFAVILVTENGCSEADLDYYRTAYGPQPELASPKIFPYTLPSAAVAEICIRHKFQGPSLVFWGSQDLGPALLQMGDWLEQGEAESGLVIAADAAPGTGPEALALYLDSSLPASWHLWMEDNAAGSSLMPRILADALAGRQNWAQPGWRVEFKEE